MNIEKLEAQLNELDRLAVSKEVSVKFDSTTSTIVATRRATTSGPMIGSSANKSAGSAREAKPTITIAEKNAAEWWDSEKEAKPTITIAERDASEGWDSEPREPNTGFDREPVEQDYSLPMPIPNKPGPVAEINLADVEVPDEYIDARMRLAIDRDRIGYLPDVKLVGFGASGIWEVTEDYSYPIDLFAIGRPLSDEALRNSHQTPEHRVPHVATVTAKKGFQFDRASIPRVFWVIISKDDLSNVPPLFHDLLYRFGGKLPNDCVSPFTEFTRNEADYLFYHLMERSGVTSWRLQIAYQAVRQFSSFAWGKKTSI